MVAAAAGQISQEMPHATLAVASMGSLTCSRAARALEWTLDAEPYVMGVFRRLFPKAKAGSHGRFTKRVATLRHSPFAAKDLLWFAQRFNLDIPTDDAALLEGGSAEYDAAIAAVQEIARGDFKRIDLVLPLREYQQEGVGLTQRVSRLLIADDLGLNG